MMQRQGFLEHGNYRYLKVASLLVGGTLLAYWITRPASGDAYGGTAFGYVLGILSALIVLVHLWYGIRKRRPPRALNRRQTERRTLIVVDFPGDDEKRKASRRTMAAKRTWRHGDNLLGWLSAHVYLGMALIVLATLHSGFRLGWNVHTLVYVLLLLVTASGFYGAYAYVRYPRLIAENIRDNTLNDLVSRIAELDEHARLRSLDLPNEVNGLVSTARHGTRLGGSLLQQLSGRYIDCPTERALQRVRELAKQLVDGEQPRLMRDLYAILLQKHQLVERARREITFNARMKLWLYLHAPLSIALLGALLAHVTVILVYW